MDEVQDNPGSHGIVFQGDIDGRFSLENNRIPSLL